MKIYERAAGDKTLPSDLRPPPVLKASRHATRDSRDLPSYRKRLTIFSMTYLSEKASRRHTTSCVTVRERFAAISPCSMNMAHLRLSAMIDALAFTSSPFT